MLAREGKEGEVCGAARDTSAALEDVLSAPVGNEGGGGGDGGLRGGAGGAAGMERHVEARSREPALSARASRLLL